MSAAAGDSESIRELERINPSVQTPISKKARLSGMSSATPLATPNAATNTLTPNAKSMLAIPPSPCLEKLGYGTGVNVFLYRRQALSGPSSSPSASAPSPWAIKKLRGSGKALPGATDKSELAERMEREAKILKSISHPNIIGYRGFRRSSDGSRLLAVENGEKSLLDLIEDEVEAATEEGEESPEPFEAKDILKVVCAVASALDYLHTDKGYLHGDIKAANVLVKGEFEQVKICDFGVALKLDENLKVSPSQNEQYVGTGPFTAPEALDGGDPDLLGAKADIFSLGCVIYEMLALEAPHVNLLRVDYDEDDDDEEEDDSFSEAQDAYEDALGTRPALPDRLNWLVGDEEYRTVLSIFYACTEGDPDKRPKAKDIAQCAKD